MSFASSSANLPAQQKKGLLDDPNSNSTNQEAHPLPYVAGWQRVGITWLDQPRNVQAIAQKGSSKGGATTGYKYYADMLALVCLGPIDAVTHVIMDQDVLWTGPVNRGSEQYVTISLGKKGNMILFWGRADQDFYPHLQALGHPAYRNQCYAYFPHLYFGAGRLNAPNVELCIQRNITISWLPGFPLIYGDVNPVPVLADLLINPLYGIGLDPTLIDQAQWLATAQQLAAEGAVFSPLITDATGVRQLITQICEYFFGYLRWTTGNLLQIGLIRDAPADLTPLLRLTASHLTDVPEISTSEWSTTFNRTVVTYVDRSRFWVDDYSQSTDDGNYAITGQTLLQTLDRKWITRAEVADQLARRAGKQYGLPVFSGTLKCRRSVVAGLAVGDWLVLDYDAANLGFALVLQCTSIESAGDSSEEIDLEVAGQQITTDPRELYDRDDVINEIPGSVDVSPLALWRVLELPKALAGDTLSAVVAALAVRGGFETVLCNVLDSQDNATYDLLGQLTDFAFGGLLYQDYPENTDILDQTVGIFVTLAGPDTTLPSQSDLAASNTKLLVFAGDEIMAVKQVVVVSANQVHLFVNRARFDTSALNHATGDPVFILPKRDLVKLHQDAFALDDSSYFKLQSASLGQQYDVSLIDPQQLTIIGRALMPQPFIDLVVNSQTGDPATFAAGSDIPFSWTLTTNEAIGNEVLDVDYYSESGIYSVLNVYDGAGTLVQMRHIKLDPGVNTYTYANSDLVADFGGSEPASFYVRLASKKTGRKSFSYLDCVINRT